MSMLKEGDEHVYSYSQLSTFDECPFAFYLDKIEENNKEDRLSNAFAERGSLIHDILDRWAQGKITKKQMLTEYKNRYSNEVVTQFPKIMVKGYAEKAYNIGVDYLTEFDEFEGYEIVASEEKFIVDLELSDGSTRPFIGIIDLMLRDKNTGELIICDHKSKSWSAFKKAEDTMYRQQLLYSAYVKEKYGKYPDILMFNLFNEMGDKATKPFSKSEYDEVIQWATDCILKMESYDVLDWMQSKEAPDFYCQFLCSTRGNCYVSSMKVEPKTKRKKK